METQRDAAHVVVSSCWTRSQHRAVHTCGDGPQWRASDRARRLEARSTYALEARSTDEGTTSRIPRSPARWHLRCGATQPRHVALCGARATGAGTSPGMCQEYRVALVFKPDECEARRLARHPRIVDLAEVAEKVAQVARLRLRRKVSDEDLHTPPLSLRPWPLSPTSRAPRAAGTALLPIAMLPLRPIAQARAPPCPSARNGLTFVPL